jgi:hypothetical protein
MRFRIPNWITTIWDAFGDWANVPVARSIRRIDIILALGGFICVGWYAYTSGWQGAILGAAMYILVVMISLWMF